MMTAPEFEQALDRWGTDLDAWPQADAECAQTLLARDRQARHLLEAARNVDAFLGGLREHVPPAHLQARIIAHAAAAGPDPVEQVVGWLTARLWRPALGAMLLATAGFLAGVTVTEPAVDPGLAEDVMSLAFSDIYAEVEDAQP